MDEETKVTRKRRSVADRVAAIDLELEKLDRSYAEKRQKLIEKKNKQFWPKQKAEIFKRIPIEMSPEEMAEKLGIPWGTSEAGEVE